MKRIERAMGTSNANRDTWRAKAAISAVSALESAHSITAHYAKKLTAFFRAALDAKAKKALIGILDEVDPNAAERRMNTFRSAFS